MRIYYFSIHLTSSVKLTH